MTTIRDTVERTGQRLRYLIEPIAEEVPGGAEIIGELRALQDTLGQMHDAHALAQAIAAALTEAAAEEGRRVSKAVVEGGAPDANGLRRLRRRDPRPGLLAPAARLHERRIAAYRDPESDWLAGRAQACLARLRGASEALAAGAPPGAAIVRGPRPPAVPQAVPPAADTGAPPRTAPGPPRRATGSSTGNA